jgi:hypothetical protein
MAHVAGVGRHSHRHYNRFGRTMKKELNFKSRLLNEKSLLGCRRPTASDELRTARYNYPFTGVKSCVPTRYTVRWRRE